MSEELELDIMNFYTSLESACVDLKRRIVARPSILEEEDHVETRVKEEAVNALFWETKEGSRGPYQQTNKKVG